MSLIVTYRRYAADCLTLAERLPDEADRRILVETAARWHELALTLETYMDAHDGREPALYLSLRQRAQSQLAAESCALR